LKNSVKIRLLTAQKKYVPTCSIPYRIDFFAQRFKGLPYFVAQASLEITQEGRLHQLDEATLHISAEFQSRRLTLLATTRKSSLSTANQAPNSP
jgi:hypothetical protein